MQKSTHMSLRVIFLISILEYIIIDWKTPLKKQLKILKLLPAS